MKSFNQILQEALDRGQTKQQKNGFWGKEAAGILVYCNRSGRFLLGLRSKKVNEPNTWGIIGGAVENQETPIEAAKREFSEETQFPADFSNLTHLYTFINDERTFMYHNYLGVVKNEFDPVPDHETQRFEWFRLDDFPSNIHFGVEELIDKRNKLLQNL